jgi:type IV secretory pathway VirB10-like protein
MALGALPALSQAAREATIETDTKAKIVLQTRLSSKLSEPGDPIRAVLDEPIYVDSQLVLPRGTEFIGRVTQVTPARRPQKQAQIDPNESDFRGAKNRYRSS